MNEVCSPGGLTPPLLAPAGQHALFAIGVGGAGPLAAILAVAGVAGEFGTAPRLRPDLPRHRAGFVDRVPAWRGGRRADSGQPGRLLSPWQGGLVFAAWAAAFAAGGTVVTARRDIT